jgi:CheY-like chemotaxis protein/predicted transcriptional regulator
MAQGYSASGRSFSADVLSRILSVLHQEGATKKTNLAGKTRLNYLTCMKYLELLRSLGLVDLVKGGQPEDGAAERICINEQGRRFNTSLSAYLAGEVVKSSNNDNTILIENQSNFAIDDKKEINNLQARKKIDTTDSKMPLNNQRKIMLVDDEQDILFTYKLFLSERCYEADVFSNSVEALHQIALFPSSYELVITDIRMSSMNGLQLYHGIRALNPNIKIMFLSALDATDELVSVLPGLTKEFVLKKPVNRDVFIRTVERALQHSGGSPTSVSPFIRS